MLAVPSAELRALLIAAQLNLNGLASAQTPELRRARTITSFPNVPPFTDPMHMSDAPNPKAHAREAIDRLPDDASWDDVMYELYVRESIDAGLADVAAGRTIPQDQVKAHIRELLRRVS
jgi:predicted transcriptional regulator